MQKIRYDPDISGGSHIQGTMNFFSLHDVMGLGDQQWERHVKQGRDVPCAIGFGISTPEQAGRMASQADGVIVGSAIVKMVARYGINCVEPVCDYVKQMKAAVGV